MAQELQEVSEWPFQRAGPRRTIADADADEDVAKHHGHSVGRDRVGNERQAHDPHDGGRHALQHASQAEYRDAASQVQKDGRGAEREEADDEWKPPVRRAVGRPSDQRAEEGEGAAVYGNEDGDPGLDCGRNMSAL